MADTYQTYPINVSSRSFNGSVWSEVNTVSSGSVRTSSTGKSSVKTPGYFTLERGHKSLPENPFSQVTARMELCRMTVVKTSPSSFVRADYGHSQLCNLIVTGVNPSEGEFSRLTAEVKSSLLSKMKADDWSIPVFVGELSETASLVADRAVMLVRLMGYLRRGRFSSFLKELANPPPRDQWKRRNDEFRDRYWLDPAGAAASAWLEYSYGWRPFVQDVQSAVNALMSSVDRQVDLEMVARSSRKRDLTTTTSVSNSYLSQGSIYVDYRTTVRSSYSCRGRVRYRARAADLPGRFGLVNPLQVAWELVPLSFVADWFLPIGNYLSSFDSQLRFDVVGGSFGYKLESTRTVEITRVRTAGASASLGPQHNRCVSLLRVPFAGNLGLSLRDVWALKNVPDSVNQALSSISLLYQAARSW